MTKLETLIEQWEGRAADGHADTDYHSGQVEAYKRVLAEIRSYEAEAAEEEAALDRDRNDIRNLGRVRKPRGPS